MADSAALRTKTPRLAGYTPKVSYGLANGEYWNDIIPLRINPSLILDLYFGKDASNNHFLSSLGNHAKLNLDEQRSDSLPYDNKSIGFTSAFDVLDHLKPDRQESLLKEIIRVSNQACLRYSFEQIRRKKELAIRIPITMKQNFMPNGDLLLTYNLPVVAVVADGKKEIGGSNRVMENIKLAVRNLGCSAYEMYVDTKISSRLKDPIRQVALPINALWIMRQDLSNFDAIITLQPWSHYLRHHRHLVYFQHHVRAYYDLYPLFLRQFKGSRQLAFKLVAHLVRFIDRLYLVPNLRRSKVITNSKNVANRLTRYYNLSASNVIYPGGPAASVTSNIGHRPNLVLSLSKINMMIKGTDLIIESARLLDEVEFLIVGSYIGKRRINEDELPSNVKLISRSVSENEKRALYNSCTVFLAPYLDEDFGITPIEANSFGKPVVFCTDSGGILESQEHLVTGYMAERNPKSFANGIEYCMLHAEEMRYKCLENAKRFVWENFRENMQHEIKNLMVPVSNDRKVDQNE